MAVSRRVFVQAALGISGKRLDAPVRLDPALVRSVHFAQDDPGLHWVKDPEISLDVGPPVDSVKIITPQVIKLPGGGYRMYYTGLGPARPIPESLGYVLSAYSSDGGAWTREPGIRLDVHPPHATRRVLCPDVIPLADGRYRMYFEARTPDRPTTIQSAISADGLEWQPEPGVRFADDHWSYGSPQCLYIKPHEAGRNGSGLLFRLYCHHYSFPLKAGLDAQNNIVSAISEDGLRFEKEPGVRVAQDNALESFSVYAPEVLRLGGDSFRMYYAAWGGQPVHGRIFAAFSKDGLHWTKQGGPCVDVGGPWDQQHTSEPCVINLPDGRYRLFYEACDDKDRWRILSATSPLRG